MCVSECVCTTIVYIDAIVFLGEKGYVFPLFYRIALYNDG